MELRDGYKRTDIGVLPEHWDVGVLRDLVDPIRTIRYGIVQPGNFDPDGRYMIRGQDYSKGWVAPQEFFRVSRRIEEPFANARVIAGDVLITIVGASTGRIAVVPAWLDGANLTQTTARIAPRTNRLDGGFCSYLLASPTGSKQVANYLKGAAQPGLNCGDLEKFLIPLPSLPEQRAIATALSDVDTLLDGLERLIAKKRDLKQATMQQLLTGQTRLPGFHGEWAVKRLGDVLTICHGKGQRDVEAANGSYPILATGGQIGTASRALYDMPSVLIGRKGTINRPQYMETPFWTVDTLFYSMMKHNNSAKFLFYRFCLVDWMQYNEASGVPSLNARTIESIEVECPEPAEQTAIAAVLSDMDAELSALEARRNKTRDIKQAMMQELLTGRIRLV